MFYILWVDDRPENNDAERRRIRTQMKKRHKQRIEFRCSVSTEDALRKLDRDSYHLVISDMGRPPNDRAGYDLHTLIQERKADGTLPMHLPFILYAGQKRPEQVAEAKKRGFRTTNSPDELVEWTCETLKELDETQGETSSSTASSRSFVLGPNDFFLQEEAKVQGRMNNNRGAIEQVRAHWDDPYVFLKEQLDAIPAGQLTSYRSLVEYAKAFIKEDRLSDWADPVVPSSRDDAEPWKDQFSIIREYTNRDRFGEVFAQLNKIYREYTYEEASALYHVATWILECVNIGLFRYEVQPRHRAARQVDIAKETLPGFEGVVYRGVNVQEAYLKDLRHMPKDKLVDLRIGIPLTLQSASKSLKRAGTFLRAAQRESGSGTDFHPMILKIRVYGLYADHLEAYWAEDRYPESVVSSICAVDIQELSEFVDEEEVLLRGPFFNAVGFTDLAHEIDRIGAVPELELVMINSNRDHIETYKLLDQSREKDNDARGLFTNIVILRKQEVMEAYFERRDEDAIADRFAQEKERRRKDLEAETGRDWPSIPVPAFEDEE